MFEVAELMERSEEPPQQSTTEEPPHRRSSQQARRAPIWTAVPDAQWNDWRWQLSHRLNSLEELSQIINLTEEEVEGCRSHHFRVDITPYFASLIDPDDPNCPIRRQVIPTGKELAAFAGMVADSLNEDAHSPVPGLVHRYPDRVLMLVTTQCASYCRYCTRSRLVGDASSQFSRSDYDAQIDYIARTPQIRDVLLSGGDPLTLPPRVLEGLLRRLRAIEHVEIIRIGSRVPAFLPQRVTPELVEMLRQFHPLWMNLHFNHAKELAPEVAVAIARLADAGIPLGAQTVLLANVNDSVEVMRELLHKLVRNRVRPYYLYQCDRGKIPVMPQYMVSQAPGKVVLRNFEGYITTYNEPNDYTGHTVARPETQLAKPARGQEGISGLLSGDADHIKPQGFDALHARGREEALPIGPLDWPVSTPESMERLPAPASDNGNGHSR